MTDVPSLLVEIARRFAYDPLGWVHAFIVPPAGSGSDWLEDWQVRAMVEIGRALATGRTVQSAVVSGHGSGKGALGAMLDLWWLTTRPMCKGVVTANTATQLATKTWPELHKWVQKCKLRDMIEINSTRLAHRHCPERWQINAIPWNEKNPEAFAGEHADHMLIRFDEASNIPPIIWDTADGAKMTGESLHFVTGNPTQAKGRFADCFGRDRSQWIRQQIDCRTLKRPGVAHELMARQIAKWGIDSDYVRIRILGQFPRTGLSQFIPQHLIDAARGRAIERHAYDFAPLVLGVDVAWTGVDESVLCERQGLYVPPLRTAHGLDPMQVADHVANRWDERGYDAVFVDGVGIGAGVVARLRQLKYRPILVNAGAKPVRQRVAIARDGGAPQEFGNLRAEMAGAVRDWLADGGCIPDDQDLCDDLSSIEAHHRDDGAIVLESKADIRARGERSPDRYDALAHTFAAPVRVQSDSNRARHAGAACGIDSAWRAV